MNLRCCLGIEHFPQVNTDATVLILHNSQQMFRGLRNWVIIGHKQSISLITSLEGTKPNSFQILHRKFGNFPRRFCNFLGLCWLPVKTSQLPVLPGGLLPATNNQRKVRWHKKLWMRKGNLHISLEDLQNFLRSEICN